MEKLIYIEADWKKFNELLKNQKTEKFKYRNAVRKYLEEQENFVLYKKTTIDKNVSDNTIKDFDVIILNFPECKAKLEIKISPHNIYNLYLKVFPGEYQFDDFIKTSGFNIEKLNEFEKKSIEDIYNGYFKEIVRTKNEYRADIYKDETCSRKLINFVCHKEGINLDDLIDECIDEIFSVTKNNNATIKYMTSGERNKLEKYLSKEIFERFTENISKSYKENPEFKFDDHDIAKIKEKIYEIIFMLKPKLKTQGTIIMEKKESSKESIPTIPRFIENYLRTKNIQLESVKNKTELEENIFSAWNDKYPNHPRKLSSFHRNLPR